MGVWGSFGEMKLVDQDLVLMHCCLGVQVILNICVSAGVSLEGLSEV